MGVDMTEVLSRLVGWVGVAVEGAALISFTALIAVLARIVSG